MEYKFRVFRTARYHRFFLDKYGLFANTFMKHKNP